MVYKPLQSLFGRLTQAEQQKMVLWGSNQGERKPIQSFGGET